MAWIKQSSNDKSTVLYVKIKPNSKRSNIIFPKDKGQDGEQLKINIKAVAVDNKANKELIRFIAKLLCIKKSGVKIARGKKSRVKEIEITSFDDIETIKKKLMEEA